MTKGRLIAVVGPSGVGKDSLISGIVDAAPHIRRARRVITRASGFCGEEHDRISPEEFAAQAKAGAFCLHWEAHGLNYGIPSQVLKDVQDGDTVIANLSRSVLAEAKRMFPALLVLHVTASPSVLAQRLSERGRDTPQDIEKRLARTANPLPDGVKIVDICNNGLLSDATAKALSALQSESA